jgi:VIT1/CCC1 family predicted Fe2+/Mn2+ transporter
VDTRVQTNGQSDKTTAELIKDLSTQLSTLVHEEIELATAELSTRGKRLGLGAGLFGATGVLLFVAFATFTASAVAALALVVPVWAAALVVGGGLALLAGAVALKAKSDVRRASPPVPTEALSSTKEDVEWLKAQTKSAKP